MGWGDILIDGVAIYGYIRVSSRPQNEEGKSISLPTQKASIQKWTSERGLVLGHVCEEISSAFRPDRCQRKLHDLVQSVGDGSVIAVYSYDRFSRNCAKGLEMLDLWAKRRIYVISVTEDIDYRTGSGRLHLTNVLAGAEYQSRITSEKIKDIFSAQKANGSFVGPAPFGFARKRKRSDATCFELVQDEYESGVIKLISMIREGRDAWDINSHLYGLVAPQNRVPIVFEQKEEELIDGPSPKAISFKNIAELLNSYEIKRRKRPWTPHTVAQAASRASLQNPSSPIENKSEAHPSPLTDLHICNLQPDEKEPDENDSNPAQPGENENESKLPQTSQLGENYLFDLAAKLESLVLHIRATSSAEAQEIRIREPHNFSTRKRRRMKK